MDSTDRSCAWHPLTREQKARLSILARAAFAKSGSGDANVWRREVAIRACGRRISEAVQRDYLTLKATFQDLAGESGRALETLLRSESEPQRVALYRLTQECGKRGLQLAYPEAICRRQYHCGLSQASPKQLWNLLYTVRNRREVKKHEGVKVQKSRPTAECPF